MQGSSSPASSPPGAGGSCAASDDAAVQAVVAHYDALGAEIANRHLSVPFAQVHARLLPWLPNGPAAVLDVGAGSGRDALALARMGHSVVAAEPSWAMREAAVAGDPDRLVRWVDDGLPDLARIRALGRAFDVVLCTAVLMHLPADVLPAAFAVIAGLLAPGAVVAVTVRPPVPGEDVRLFHDHRPVALRRVAETAGLSVLDAWRDVDVMRGDRCWDGLVLSAR